jgi:methylated-DNA-[protein]-cysteine S-methyltransferase
VGGSAREEIADPSAASSMSAIALFPTSLGLCGIAWGDGGIVGVQLPEEDEGATRARMTRRFPGSPERPLPADVALVTTQVTQLLGGHPVTFQDVKLDMSAVPPFHRRVYEVALAIPPGSTTTYGDVARLLGQPGAARAVGQALGRNPFAPIVPCHRVLGANGVAGGFSAHGGVETKRRLLALEGVTLRSALPLFV